MFNSGESGEEPFKTTVDTTSDDSAITMGKPVTTAFISNLIQIPTEQVGCLHVTNQLQEFLDQYLPKLTEKAFEHIYQILQVLDKQTDLQMAFHSLNLYSTKKEDPSHGRKQPSTEEDTY